MAFSDYQYEIYLNGLAGVRPPYSADLAELERAARERLDPGAYWYVAGSAGTGATDRANREAFDRRRIVPRMLRDVSARDLGTELFGRTYPAPVALAPVGVQSIVHPHGELATSRAAASLGLPMVLSTASSHTMEEVAAAGGPRWYQLYWPHDDEVTLSLLEGARKNGYDTLVVTLDTWTLAWRPNDLDRAYLPFLRGTGLAIPLSDPVFRSRLARPVEEDLDAAIMQWVPMFNGRAHTWDQLPLLRENWDGPIVLKGVQHVDDARRAADAGMDGVVVSNHGGRQVDGALASLDALAPIAEAVGDRLTVLFDSGVRSGADVVKALALGARAVLLGRPYMWGLACGGEDGVRHVLRSLLAELDLTLGLAGHRTPGGLDPSVLVPQS
ncbi:lactate 2-monooxygenase [Planomonospora venezuelensis]|uniref:Isopentenyl diphosphate isomerase/L-lactate dehydrogenase-like FMN-dependent dehydrogenase n=1 Tax=Planomonospora venezuelensis TaxID=1999 RepID=A0A841DEB1_PLAVE|nr:isopentenyl diphosphate isomerase/L-lactate dehydrogenase-like FMN-dependent dehydrogenase [Planomonospora venezuelensis]GIN03231.1 L-lactate 2-monooxygenase [Planomonospora venezuelensis]